MGLHRSKGLYCKHCLFLCFWMRKKRGAHIGRKTVPSVFIAYHGTLPYHSRPLPPSWCYSAVFKRPFYPNCLRMVRKVKSITMNPLPNFSGFEVSSLIKSNVVWDTVVVNRVFCKSTGGSFGRSIAFREDISIPRTSI